MPSRRILGLAILALVLTGAVPIARAQKDAYLRFMPTPQQVVERTPQGTGSELALRQVAALQYMSWMMDVIQGPRRLGDAWTREELQRRGSYDAYAADVRNSVLAGRPPQAHEDFNRNAKELSRDPTFRREMMDVFIPADFQAEFAKLDPGPAESSGALDESLPGSNDPSRFEVGGVRGRILQALEGADTWAEFVAALPSTWQVFFRRNTWILIFGIGFALAFLRSLEPLRFVPGAPSRLFVGGKRFRLGHVTGTVKDIQRWTSHTVVQSSSTFTNVDGSTNTEVRDRIVGTNHLQIMLTTPSGKDWDLQFQDMNYPVAAGHHMSAIWAIRGRAKRGSYIIYRSHELDRIQYENAVNDMVRPTRKPFLLLLPFLLAVGLPWLIFGIAVAAYCLLVSIARRLSRARLIRLKIWKILDEKFPAGTSSR